MSIVIASVRASVQELLRLPSFLLPLAVFPTVLYLFLGLQQPGSTDLIYLGYCAFAILGTMMFQFGVGIAATRDDPWNTYTLTLPGRAWQRIAALLTSGALFSTAFCIPISAAAFVAGKLHPLSVPTVAAVLGALLLGAIVHGLFGLALGYWLPARGAASITNLIYFPLSFIGGLFGPVTDGLLGAIHPWSPTGAWMDLIYAALTNAPAGQAILVGVGYAAVFAIAAGVGYRRVERTVHR
ncbi:ABC transporter permease [Microbacterium trichothecenolyticum]|uniref:ABC-2 type transport system permease protein n=1 Tax=Microbacterium trichothecenolyticum TaxID=69370 RepID=A0ABU0TQY7_MICTR|nr:ABC transporter permease [Microbacterium trichothecenolyticum]MDQ1122082.1 ABC-2 type transport system permease protein [Microbacterium trichothecenolyticum]